MISALKGQSSCNVCTLTSLVVCLIGGCTTGPFCLITFSDFSEFPIPVDIDDSIESSGLSCSISCEDTFGTYDDVDDALETDSAVVDALRTDNDIDDASGTDNAVEDTFATDDDAVDDILVFCSFSVSDIRDFLLQ